MTKKVRQTERQTDRLFEKGCELAVSSPIFRNIKKNAVSSPIFRNIKKNAFSSPIFRNIKKKRV